MSTRRKTLVKLLVVVAILLACGAAFHVLRASGLLFGHRPKVVCYDIMDRPTVTTLKVMTYNILRDGIGEAGDRREQIAAVIRKHNPDVLCMQEGGDNAFWVDFATAEGYGYVANMPGEYYPSIYSRLPVLRSVTSTDLGARFTYLQLALGDRTAGVYCVHLRHEARGERLRLKEVDRLQRMVQRHGDHLVCVAGDFNSRTEGEWGEPWRGAGPTSFMGARGYADCYRKLNSAPGYTCHLSVDKLRAAYPDVADAVDPAADVAWQVLRAKYPDIHEKLATSAEAVRSLLKERIDYIFADPPLARGLTACIVDDSPEAYRASDHLPVIATFDLQQATTTD